MKVENMLNEQEKFWSSEIADSYMQENDNYDFDLGLEAWAKILHSVDISNLNSVLECGCNVGRNLRILEKLLPSTTLNVIEINEKALGVAKSRHNIERDFCGSIKDCDFNQKFNLVFTSGVLIHINPDDLLISMKKLYEMSSKYILLIEYFNRTSVTIKYRDSENKLFKRDFGKLFQENFECTLVDYGFLWGHIYDLAGFDDVTWWLFEKHQDIHNS